MEKLEREAKEAGRESWYLSWALDSTTQERSKGKTVEADVAILVISARKGEFETGFERGGQTREHIMLVKTAGVSKLIVAINKMDDPTVNWEESRYNEIKDRLIPFVKASGYNPKTDVYFIPVSAYTGVNLKDRVPKSVAPWWTGTSFLEHMDAMPMVDRKVNAPLMMPISEKYKDMGTIVVGKIESGHIRKGDNLVLMPNREPVEIAAMYNEMEEEVNSAVCGDNVRIRLRGVDDEDITPGFVLTSPNKPIHAVSRFEAQLAILEHKNIICAGYSAVMHVHTLAEEVTNNGPVCVERFADYPQLGRFTLRDEGRTIAIGKVSSCY
ncbi:translation termination factor GTPase [Salix suchowensis]|nr:translation termination factor GTPase [Salix suchowensis]